MDEKQYAELAHQANLQGGTIRTDGTNYWLELLPEPTLNELKEAKGAEIRTVSERAIKYLQEGYTLGEINTFEQQYLGALEIIKNGVADDISAMSKDAQFVVVLAATRSIVGGVENSPQELAQKIIANYTAAAEYTRHVLGVQQGLETRARNAKTAEELQEIIWPWPVAQ